MKLTKRKSDEILMRLYKQIARCTGAPNATINPVYNVEESDEVVGNMMLCYVEVNGKQIPISIYKIDTRILVRSFSYPALEVTWHFNPANHSWSGLEPVGEIGTDDYISRHQILTDVIAKLKVWLS